MENCRRTVFIRSLIAAAVFLIANAFQSAFAQLPPIPEEMKRMYMFVGEWSGTTRYTHGVDSVDFKTTVKCTKTSDGWGVLAMLAGESRILGKYRETDLFAYDPDSKKYHMYVVSNAGEVHDHVCEWASDLKNVFTARFEGTRDGNSLTEETVFMFKSAKELHFRSVNTVAGKPPEVYEGTLKRK